LSAVEIDGMPVVPRKVIERFGVSDSVEVDRGSEGLGVRSAVVETKSLSCLLLRLARSLISKFPIYLNKIYILQWFQPFIGNGQLSYLLAVLSTHQLFNRDRKFSKT
jgi:hypothetical protein